MTLPFCTVYENEDQLLWDPNILPEREVEEFLYRAVKRRWHEMAGSQLPEGEAVKDSEQVGCPWGGGTARPEGREPTWSYACDKFIWKPLVTGNGGVGTPTLSISPALW